MFGQSFVVNRALRAFAKAMGADEEDAKAIGTAAGLITTFVTLDLAGGTWTAETLGSDEAVEEMRDKWLDQ